jgi:choline dehydrogenase-like flavoprotein
MTQSDGEVDRSPRSGTDVCIIGAGVAGALVAHSLARRGYDVVVLEAGPRFEFDSRRERMEQALRPEFNRLKVWDMGGQRDRHSSSGDVDYALNKKRVKGVGGTTLHWLGTTPRLHEEDFEMHSRYGVASDWPISYEDLRPYYAAAESELGVAGAPDNPFAPPREADYPMEAFPPSRSDSLYAEACEELDIAVHSVPQARNSGPYDGRSQCLGYSTCVPVCPSGAKYSGDVHIEKAEAEGATVIDRVPVQSLDHGPDGDRVRSVVYVTPSGDEYRQEARLFVVACGGVETPRLLLLSRSDEYPDGLANTSGLVGAYFTEHPIVEATAEVTETTNRNPVGFYTSASQEFYRQDDQPPGSIYLQFENIDPESPLDAGIEGGDTDPRQNKLDPFQGDEWGDALQDSMARDPEKNRVAIDAICEMLPRKSNRVTLDPTKTDEHGNPVPDVSFGLSEFEHTTLRRALDIQTAILETMGATNIQHDDASDPVYASHHMGTTRMGTDPQESVVTPNLRTHDLDNLFIASSSVFVTSGAVNPTLTIAALSLRLADHIHERFGE